MSKHTEQTTRRTIIGLGLAATVACGGPEVGTTVRASEVPPPVGSGGPTPIEVTINPVATAVGFGIYPEAILCSPGGEPRCGPAAPFAVGGSPALAQELARGLAAWRYPGLRGACAGCHAPDAMDLAAVGFSDADIERRALDHVSTASAAAIVDFIHAKRAEYGFVRLLHPDRYRPFQPAHEPFHGPSHLPVDSHDAQRDRDTQLAQRLAQVAPRFTTGTVRNLTEARLAYQELLAIDLTQLRLGVPFDRLSEDAALGRTSVFEWFPGLAMMPKPEHAAEWYGAVDAYLAQPTDENLWAYYDRIDDWTECEGGLDATYADACEWSRLKWRSLQVLQHMLRHGTDQYPDVLADRSGAVIDHVDLAIHRSPIWEAGDFIRRTALARPDDVADASCSARPCVVFPPHLAPSIPSDNDELVHQDEVFKQSWFVMSWVHDPALMVQGNDVTTITGDYLESVLLPYYDVHHAFVFAKMAVEKSAATEWFYAGGPRQGTGKIASGRTFSFKQIRDNFSSPPSDDPRYAMHRRIFANFARMWIHLVADDLRRTGSIYSRLDVLKAVRFMRSWIARIEGQPDPNIEMAAWTIEMYGSAAVELRPAGQTEEILQPIGRWSEFLTPTPFPRPRLPIFPGFSF